MADLPGVSGICVSGVHPALERTVPAERARTMNRVNHFRVFNYSVHVLSNRSGRFTAISVIVFHRAFCRGDGAAEGAARGWDLSVGSYQLAWVWLRVLLFDFTLSGK